MRRGRGAPSYQPFVPVRFDQRAATLSRIASTRLRHPPALQRDVTRVIRLISSKSVNQLDKVR